MTVNVAGSWACPRSTAASAASSASVNTRGSMPPSAALAHAARLNRDPLTLEVADEVLPEAGALNAIAGVQIAVRPTTSRTTAARIRPELFRCIFLLGYANANRAQRHILSSFGRDRKVINKRQAFLEKPPLRFFS